MILLTNTTHTLEVVTSSGADIDYTVSYVDITTSSFSPDSVQGTITTATTTTIVSAPAASTQRQIKLITLRNVDATLSNSIIIQKDVSGANYRQTGSITLYAGETFVYSDTQGYYILNSSGVKKQTSYLVHPSQTVMMSPTFATANITSVKAITSTSTFALYIGRASRSVSSVTLQARVTTAMATITWGEVAIAKGTPVIGGNPTLTVVGYADVSASYNAIAIVTTSISVSAGQSIDTGDDLWVLVGNQATTAVQLRAQSIADDLGAGFWCAATTRPSTIVGTPTVFTVESTTSLPFWVALMI